MKKIYIWSILLLLILSVVSCSNENRSPCNTQATSFYNSDALVEYINEIGLSDEVITYDEIAYIGNFKDVIFLTDIVQSGDYSQYMYTLQYNELEFSLYVYHEKRDLVDTPALQYDVTQMSDLRQLPESVEDKHGNTEIGMFLYTYASNGTLLSIRWDYNGIHYVLSGDFVDYNISRAPDAFITKLLSPTTIAEAEAMVKQ